MRRRGFRFSQNFREPTRLDHRTGRPPAVRSSVSIAATTAMQTVTLSTAVFIAGLKDGKGLLMFIPGADALLFTKQGRVGRTTGRPFAS